MNQPVTKTIVHYMIFHTVICKSGKGDLSIDKIKNLLSQYF